MVFRLEVSVYHSPKLKPYAHTRKSAKNCGFRVFVIDGSSAEKSPESQSCSTDPPTFQLQGCQLRLAFWHLQDQAKR